MHEAKLHNLLKKRREAAGFSQQGLAVRVGVSRQAIINIEAGRQVPSTSLGLLLARTLGCRLEELFRLDDEQPRLAVEVAEGGNRDAKSSRVALGRVRGRWIAHHLADGRVAADGLLAEDGGSPCSLLTSREVVERTVLVAGCAPLLGALGQRVGARFGDARLTWIGASSRRALELLEGGQLHVAGAHLCPATSPAQHVAEVRARFPDERMLLANLTRWRQGFVVAPENPLEITRGADLLRPGLRVAHREVGAGARKLVTKLLEAEGAADRQLAGPLAYDHAGVAQLVSWGAADVGVAIESVALAAGLDFVPLAEERFDLVVPAELATQGPVSRLLEALDERAFRDDIAALPGYDSGITGHVLTIDAATSDAIEASP